MPTDRYQPLRDAIAAGPTRKPIPSFPGYEADENGAIWSVASNWRGLGARTLAPSLKFGYERVRLVIGPKQAIRKPVHQLVCEAFHGPRPEACEVRHLNGDRRDNRPSNLAWGTRSENARDRSAHGTCKARENGVLGAAATKDKFAHLSVDATCPVCGNVFATRAWRVRSAAARGRMHTCSFACGRLVAHMRRRAALADGEEA